MSTSLLDEVLAELDARRGQWAQVARDLEPNDWESYYSWLTKLAQRRIPDPGVKKIQRLADHFRAMARAA